MSAATEIVVRMPTYIYGYGESGENPNHAMEEALRNLADRAADYGVQKNQGVVRLTNLIRNDAYDTSDKYYIVTLTAECH